MARTSRYLLAWLDRREGIVPDTLSPIRQAIEDQVTGPREDVAIDVWLDSPGGDAHAAFKLALMLHDAADSVRVVVPDFAKSAATLLALAGKPIYMAPAAEFGPLDAQMPEEGSLMGAISALSIARAADDVASNAVDIALTGGADVLNVTGLSRAETMDMMLRFSANFSEPLVRQLDPRVVHDAKQMLNVTVKYAERLLTMTGCDNASAVAEAMVENYPTHGFVIDLAEADRLDLPVRPLREYEYVAAVRALHRVTEAGQGVIEFGPIEAFLPEEEDEDEGGETKDEQAEAEGRQDGDDRRGEEKPRINGAEAAETR